MRKLFLKYKIPIVLLFLLTFPVPAAALIPLSVNQGGTGNNTFTVGNCLKGNGTSPLTSGPCGGNPASPDTSVQFNNAGSFGGSANFTWDNTNQILKIGGANPVITSAGGQALFTIQGGNGVISGDEGDIINIIGGTGVDSGPGGDVVTIGGTGGITGRGGELVFRGGAAGATSGSGGDVVFIGGNASSGAPGNIRFNPGVGSGVAGNLYIYNPIAGANAIFDTSLITSSDQTFTFPNKSGTFALTTDLVNNYVPYTGANTFVDLGGQALFTLGTITAPNIQISNGGGFEAILNSTNITANTNFELPNILSTGLVVATPTPTGTDFIYMYDVADNLPVNANIGTGLSYDHSSHTLSGATPTLAATQIAFGDGSNLMTSSSNFIWNDGTSTLTLGTSSLTGLIKSGGGLFLSAAAGGAGTGSNVELDGGYGASNNQAGGIITAYGGGGGTGGDVHLTAGSTIGGNGDGGNGIFVAGSANGTGNGGIILFQSGGGGTTSGHGGNIQFTSGSASAGNNNGGNLLFTPGAKSGSGANGTIQLNDPTSGGTAFLITSSLSGGQNFTFPNQSGVIYALANPAANTIAGWDNTDSAPKNFTIGTGLTYTHATHTLSATGSGGTVTSVASADGSITVTNPTTTVDLAVVKSPKLTTGRTISISGDLAYTSPSFDGTGNVTAAGTLATVNSNVGSFGSATQVGTFTVNGKGLITAAGNTTITPAVGSITGLGTGVATALGVNVGAAGAFVVNGGALGTPSSGVATNLTGTASGLTAGNVTTNANLTGPITSVGNATSVAAQTGTGSTFVMQASPTLTTPTIGVATATSLATSAASPLLLTNGQLVTIALTSQTVGGATLTIPNFANVNDTFAFTTLAQTFSNKTLSGVTMADATNIILNTGTGTKIGTATNQKLGFFNSTPIVQPTGDVVTALQNLGLVASATIGTATNATNVAITDDTSTNATMYPTWVTTNTGNLPLKVSSTKITFNPSFAALTTTTFGGDSAASDVAPTVRNFTGQNSYEQATTNITGGGTIIEGGISLRKFTIVDYTGLSGKTVTLHVISSLGASVDTVLTEGSNWTAATSNNATATSLAAAITAVSGVHAVASSAVVFFSPANSTIINVMGDSNAAAAKMTTSQKTDGAVVLATNPTDFTAASFGFIAAPNRTYLYGGKITMTDGSGNFPVSLAYAGSGLMDVTNSLRFQTGNVQSIWTSVGTGGAFSHIATLSGTAEQREIVLTPNYTAGANANNRFGIYLTPTYNFGGAQTGTATDYFLNATETNLNGATHNLMDLQVGSASKFKINNTGIITNYNGIATVSNGIPSELGTVDLTAQSAAKTATTIYTPTASGMYRISVNLQVTTASSTSSILAGTTGVVITYTEPDGSVAQSVSMALDDQSGNVISVGTGNTANTTGTSSHGQLIIYAKTGVAIQYAIGYTSVGVTAMQYAAHLKVEAL